MKKILSKIFLLLSYIPFILIIINLIKSYFFGFEVVMMLGLDIPLRYGFEAIGNYLWFTFSLGCFGIITLPIMLICIIYQIIYFSKRKKNIKRFLMWNNY